MAGQFASDNYAGICPEALEAMIEANRGHEASYGEDRWTREASDLIRDLFETRCEVFFVFNGTAANSLALASLCQSYHSIICHELAHVETDECGGPEFFSNGTKILLAGGSNGKLDPGAVAELTGRRSDIHFPKPKALTITQATETGTVYTPAELESLRETAAAHGLRIHMDGARFANAVESLGVSPADLTWKKGVDVLSLGGVKDGTAAGEAVVFFNLKLAEDFDYRCKQAGQLASKMRFLAAPWVGLLKSGAWLGNAGRANRGARALKAGLEGIPGVRVLYPVEANAVFVEFADKIRKGLRDRGWLFYDFIGAGGSRLMCSWDTSEADVRAFVSDARELSR